MNADDLRVDVFRAGLRGEQCLVRITHVPTGISADCREHRSQILNRVEALKRLRAKLDEPTPKAEEELVPVTLVAVEVFGVDPYGLMDAVSSWSDCNRARGQIFRVDDCDPQYRASADVIRVFVPASELPKLVEKRWGEEFE